MAHDQSAQAPMQKTACRPGCGRAASTCLEQGAESTAEPALSARADRTVETVRFGSSIDNHGSRASAACGVSGVPPTACADAGIDASRCCALSARCCACQRRRTRASVRRAYTAAIFIAVRCRRDASALAASQGVAESRHAAEHFDSCALRATGLSFARWN